MEAPAGPAATEAPAEEPPVHPAPRALAAPVQGIKRPLTDKIPYTLMLQLSIDAL